MFRLAALTLGAPFLAALPVALMVTLLAPGGPDQPAGAGTGAGPVAGLPPAMLGLYRRASATCPGLSWTVLAAVGTIESANGTSAAPGVHSGANSAGAEGPMQFEPATFASYALPVPPGGAVPPTPYDPTDAVYAAARDLCTNGAGTATGLPAAVFAYNHDHAYVHQVLTLAAGYAATPAGATPAGATTLAAAEAVAFARSELGVPYLWGGEGPGGFDCSGLVQAAYASAGVSLPRVAQAQFDAGPALPPGQALVPGDLVFFGSSTSDVTHVGIYVGGGDMIDAPHTGAFVRREPYRWSDYLGATRPAGP